MSDTIPRRFLEQAHLRPNAPAYAEKVGGQWKQSSWADYTAQVKLAARALLSLGLAAERGGVAIIGFNRPEWTILNMASMCVGGAPAGIYTTSSPDELAYVVDHCGAQLLLVEDLSQWAKVVAAREKMPQLKHVVLMRGVATPDDLMAMSWEGFLALSAGSTDEAVTASVERLREDDMATLIYTSGTTGPPKGVMLSHRNLAWTARVAQQMTGIHAEGCALSYLPLSHIAEQMFSVHGPATIGYAVYFAESIDKVADNLKEVRPFVFFGVPRIWEKMFATISQRLGEATGAKRAISLWARKVGAQASSLRNEGRSLPPLLALQYRLANRLVFTKLRAAIGLDRALVSVSGAAPIGREVLELLASLDLVVHEVYGQSEGCGPSTFNMPGATRIGTVGKAIPGAEVRIADDGEILVRGPNIFLGYYKEPAATAETLIDGWLHSGDLGAFDASGFLSITGRKKEILITSGGKNITPKNLEEAFKRHPLIGEAVVIGDRRKYLTVLLTLDPEVAPRWAADHGISGDLPKSEAIHRELAAHMEVVNAEVSRVEGIKKYTLLPRPFSIPDGELTPTLKVKRRVVNTNWAAEIEAMYAE